MPIVFCSPQLLLLLASLLCCSSTAVASPPTVTTKYGAVEGLAYDGAFAFKGIPFAAPPVGTRRFAHTQPVESWNSPLQAINFAAGCMQTCDFPIAELSCPQTISEDCLYLNIYTPTLNASANLPVIIFFHGGQYIAGSGGVPLYDGTDLARNQNVVLVTINYRLGIFGALYTGTVKGNFMLTDQRQSMIFVSEVIAQFGGNPNLVTITGQSAGAMSVAAHLTSPKSWPYFQRAIVVSDPFGILFPSPETAMILGQKVLADLNCSATGGALEVECLQAVSAEEINALKVNYAITDNDFLLMAVRWAPVIDGDELPYEPLYALTHNKFSPVPIMMGTVANESVPFVYGLLTFPTPPLAFDVIIDILFDGPAVGDEVIDFYGTPPAKYKTDARLFGAVLTTDYLFYCATRHVLDAIAAVQPVYTYIFDIVASYNAWIYGATNICADLVCHQQDLTFIFNPFQAARRLPVPNLPTPTPAELELAHFIQTVWGNFARSGNPNPLPNITFPAYNASQPMFVNYSTPVSVMPHYRNKECAFWETIGFNRN